MKSVENYKDGKLDGHWTMWHDNRQKMAEQNYKDENEVSRKEWDKEGNEMEL